MKLSPWSLDRIKIPPNLYTGHDDQPPEPPLLQRHGVDVVDNHIYFYSDIDPAQCLALIKAIRDVDAGLRYERQTRYIHPNAEQVPIWLHIHSGGGDAFAALGIADQLNTIASPICSIIEGVCASAATLISLSCKHRYILPNSFMMIHQLQGAAWGTYEQIKDSTLLYDMMMVAIKGFYLNRTRITAEQIDEFLKRDSWFNAKQALELGLVGEVMNGQTAN